MTETTILAVLKRKGNECMEQQENATEKKPGPILTMINWTMGIMFCATLIGLGWKYIIKPLFLG